MDTDVTGIYFAVEYKKGVDSGNADGLSRA